MRTSWRGSRAILPAFLTPRTARSFRRWTVTSTDSSRLRSAPKRRAPLPTSFIGIGAAAGAAAGAVQVLRDHRGVRDVRDALETLVLRVHKARTASAVAATQAGKVHLVRKGSLVSVVPQDRLDPAQLLFWIPRLPPTMPPGTTRRQRSLTVLFRPLQARVKLLLRWTH